jgi:uncharacterized protein YqgV (UPF0045/DUF77 family)
MLLRAWAAKTILAKGACMHIITIGSHYERNNAYQEVHIMLLAQVALYPIEAENADQVINASLGELNDNNAVNFAVGPVNTEMQGEAEEIFSALQRLFERACRDGTGEVSMVATITNARR